MVLGQSAVRQLSVPQSENRKTEKGTFLSTW
jgi:hypothetical protein